MTSKHHNSQNFWQRRSHTQQTLLGMVAVIAGSAAIFTIMAIAKPTPQAKEAEQTPLPKVETLVVHPSPQRLMVSSQGTVEPIHEIKLISEVGGRVIAVADDYANGGFFSKGMAIVTIDPRDYEFALRQVESQLAKAEELYAIEKGLARQAKGEWRDIGNAEANDLFLRKPQLASAKAALDAAVASRDQARLNLERTQIRAPFDGRIRSKHVDVGQYVTPGTIIADVFSTEAVQVRLPLTDHQVAKVSLPLTPTASATATAPEVTLSAVYGGKTFSWKGEIVRTEASIDVKSRVTYAVAEVLHPYHSNAADARPPLSVGMYVNADIYGKVIDGVVRLPRKVLQRKDQITLVNADNELAFKTVELAQHDGEAILVTGLSNGDRVLLSRVPYAVAGLKVQPADDSSVAELPSSPSPSPAHEG